MSGHMLTVRLTEEMHEALRGLAFDERKPMNHIVVEALHDHLEKVARKREKASASPRR